MDIIDFLKKTRKTQTFVEFLKEHLILFHPNCPKCGMAMSRDKNTDFVYLCNRRYNGSKCKSFKSILTSSIFEKMKVGFFEIFYIMNLWRLNVQGNFISDDLELGGSTISRITSLFNRVVMFSDTNSTKVIGGKNMIVEIDESLLVKHKYWRGRRLRNQKWVIGGVVRGNINDYFVERVDRRDRVSLLNVIRRRVAPGSIIITDKWGGYFGLEIILYEMDYTHLVVNHRLWFVDPTTGANTQTVECFWSVLKRILRKRGTNIGDVERRLIQFHVEVFKRVNRRNCIMRMIDLMQFYTLYATAGE